MNRVTVSWEHLAIDAWLGAVLVYTAMTEASLERGAAIAIAIVVVRTIARRL